jgi:membrane associated rhomboid family serine protease
MGIHDRDYARATPSGPGRIPSPGRLGPSLRGLSVVHWLIIINCAIFMIDAFCLARGVLRPVHTGDFMAAAANIDPRRDQLIYPSVPAMRPANAAIVRADILLASSRQKVGEREWRYMPPMTAIGHFSTAKAFFGLEVWRFVTFQFLHADLTHLAFNMIGLWFFGPIVEQHLRSRKRFLAYYLVCGIFGALLYLLLNLLGSVAGLKLPGVLFTDIFTSLVGASAGVFGVLMASAKIAGDATMYVFMVIPMRVSTGAYLLTAAACFNLLIGGSNAGGDAAHVGGAVAGFFFIRNIHLLNDFFEILGPKKQSARTATKKSSTQPGNPSATDSRVDEVLDKVRRQGLQSLTDSEKNLLRQATDERRGRG